MKESKLTRRQLMKVTVMSGAGVALAACAPAAAPAAPAAAPAAATEAPKAAQAPKATDVPKPTEAPKAAETPKPTDVPKLAAVMERRGLGPDVCLPRGGLARAGVIEAGNLRAVESPAQERVL